MPGSGPSTQDVVADGCEAASASEQGAYGRRLGVAQCRERRCGKLRAYVFEPITIGVGEHGGRRRAGVEPWYGSIDEAPHVDLHPGDLQVAAADVCDAAGR